MLATVNSGDLAKLLVQTKVLPGLNLTQNILRGNTCKHSNEWHTLGVFDLLILVFI